MNLESHLMTFVPCFDVSMPWGTPDGWDRLHLIPKAPHITPCPINCEAPTSIISIYIYVIPRRTFDPY